MLIFFRISYKDTGRRQLSGKVQSSKEHVVREEPMRCRCRSPCYGFPPYGKLNDELPFYHLRWCELDEETLDTCRELRIKSVSHNGRAYSIDNCSTVDQFNCKCSGIPAFGSAGSVLCY